MTALTRRAAFAAPLALGLPVASLSDEHDPAIAAFAAWRFAAMDHVRLCDGNHPEEVGNAACAVSAKMLTALARVQATTIEGVRLQLLGAIYSAGDPGRGCPGDPLNWRPEHFNASGYEMDDAALPILWSAVRALEGAQA